MAIMNWRSIDLRKRMKIQPKNGYLNIQATGIEEKKDEKDDKGKYVQQITPYWWNPQTEALVGFTLL